MRSKSESRLTSQMKHLWRNMEPKIFTNFKNTYVHIICMNLRSSQNRMSGNVISEGFLTDFCDEYFFLSVEPMGEITEAIRRDDVVKVYLPVEDLAAIIEAQGISGEEH